jgi:hypothetical protein
MPRLDGEVFLLGTAISAPVPFQIYNALSRLYGRYAALASIARLGIKTPKASNEARLIPIFLRFASLWNIVSKRAKQGRTA